MINQLLRITMPSSKWSIEGFKLQDKVSSTLTWTIQLSLLISDTSSKISTFLPNVKPRDLVFLLSLFRFSVLSLHNDIVLKWQHEDSLKRDSRKVNFQTKRTSTLHLRYPWFGDSQILKKNFTLALVTSTWNFFSSFPILMEWICSIA